MVANIYTRNGAVTFHFDSSFEVPNEVWQCFLQYK